MRQFVVSLLLLACLMIVSSAQGAEPLVPAPEAVEARRPLVLIRPRNYDPRDPAAYTRLGGEPTPGHRADGLFWNDPDPLQLDRKTGHDWTSGGFQIPTAVIAAQPAVITQPPSPQVIPLGHSVQGLPLVLYVFGHEGQPLLVFGAIHGSEPNSGLLARQLFEHLIQNPAAYRGQRVAILPVANPDGMARFSRLNQHQIDLNRNFPASNWAKTKPGSTFGGEAPGSEPETQAIIKAVDLLQPRCIITIHAITNGRHCNNYDGPAADWAHLLKKHNGYPVTASIGYPTPGSFGSWAGRDRQIPTITLELPHDLSGSDAWQQHREALLAVIQTSGLSAAPVPAK